MANVDARRVAVRMLVMDVDGTLTDGTIYTGPDGECMKAFNVKDGLGIAELLPKRGIVPVIITGRGCASLEARAAELGISELHQRVADKPAKMREVAERLGCGLGEAAYIGDDLNDLACMQAVQQAGGVVGCPADAVPEVCEVADYVAARDGGHGAVREFVEWLLVEDVENATNGVGVR